MTTQITISNTSQSGSSFSHTLEVITSDSALPILIGPEECRTLHIWAGKTFTISELPLEENEDIK